MSPHAGFLLRRGREEGISEQYSGIVAQEKRKGSVRL